MRYTDSSHLQQAIVSQIDETQGGVFQSWDAIRSRKNVPPAGNALRVDLDYLMVQISADGHLMS